MPAGRPPKDPKAVEEALRLCAAGMTPEEAAAELGGRISWRTIYRAQERMRRAPAKPAAPAVKTPATAPPLPASKRLEIDQLVARSPTWARVKDILARTLAPYPEAARAVASALRSEAL